MRILRQCSDAFPALSATQRGVNDPSHRNGPRTAYSGSSGRNISRVSASFRTAHSTVSVGLGLELHPLEPVDEAHQRELLLRLGREDLMPPGAADGVPADLFFRATSARNFPTARFALPLPDVAPIGSASIGVPTTNERDDVDDQPFVSDPIQHAIFAAGRRGERRERLTQGLTDAPGLSRSAPTMNWNAAAATFSARSYSSARRALLVKTTSCAPLTPRGGRARSTPRAPLRQTKRLRTRAPRVRA